MEYPVNDRVELDPLVAAWGPFKADELNVNEAGDLTPGTASIDARCGVVNGG